MPAAISITAKPGGKRPATWPPAPQAIALTQDIFHLQYFVVSGMMFRSSYQIQWYESSFIMRTMTQVDIARELGISQSTVKAVFKPDTRIRLRPETRQRVLEAARRLGYVPNRAASNLRSRKTNTIIVATFEALHHPYVHDMVEELHVALTAHGYEMTLELMHRSKDQEDRYRTFLPGRCDGVVMLQLPSTSGGILENLRDRGMPIVAIDPAESSRFSCVDYDRVEAIRIGVVHLLEQGHRRVALILDVEEGLRRQQRLKGYRLALEQFGLSFDEALLFPSPVEADERKLWKRIAGLEQRATGLVCYNNELAMRLRLSARKEQFRVPSDVAIVAQGNSRMADWGDVSLTAVDTNRRGVVKAVVGILLEEMKDPRAPPRKVLVKPFLVKRASSDGEIGGDGTEKQS